MQAGKLPGHPQRAASLKPEPLLGKLKDARILLSGSQSVETIDSEPNAHSNRLGWAGKAYEGEPSPFPDSRGRMTNGTVEP